MPLLNRVTGDITFSDGLALHAGMAARELSAGPKPVAQEEGVLALPPHPYKGGALAPLCAFDENGLYSVALSVHAVGSRAEISAERQRAFLFSALCLRDPCLDSRRGVRVRCPFGEITVCGDPHTGAPSARIAYAAY